MLPLSLLIVTIHLGNAETFVIQAGQKGPLLNTDFVSNTIGFHIVSNWPSQFFESVQVNTLAKGLYGSFIRFGGTPEDQTIYETTSNLKHPQWYVLNLTQFTQIANFAQRNGWKFIFGLNAQFRYANNSWDPSNTDSLLDAIVKTKNDQLVYAFELGNEPDLYNKTNDQNLGYSNVSTLQMAKDYNTFDNLLINKFQDHQMIVPKLYGPDIASNVNWLKSFLMEYKNINSLYLNGITVHFYYGSNAQLNTTEDFVDVQVLDRLYDYLDNVTETVWEHYNKGVAIILGETSSTYGGGTKNLSMSYVSGFMMLDKLGLSSIYGIFSVIRQQFCGGNYGLIGDGSWNEFMANPNYWSQYLFKNLVGNKALYVNGQMERGRSLRVYAFCCRINDGYGVYNYPIGSVTVLMLNLYNKSVDMSFKLNGTSDIIGDNAYYDEYLLTSYPDVVNSRDMFLNGKLIRMPNESTLPVLNGTRKSFGSIINIPAFSYGFVVMVNANVTVCTY